MTTEPTEVTADRDVEAVAAVLLRHQRIPLFDGTQGQRCVGCDNLLGATDGPNSPSHVAHLAAALLPLIREREAAAWERALREAADDVHEVGGTSGGVPVWRAQVEDWLRERAAGGPYAGSEGGDE